MTKKITIKSDTFEGIKTKWDNFNEELYKDCIFMKKIKRIQLIICTNDEFIPGSHSRMIELIRQNKFKHN